MKVYEVSLVEKKETNIEKYGHIHYNNGRYMKVENFKRKIQIEKSTDTSIFHLLDIDMEMDALSIWNSLNAKR